ncbi:DNA repair protein [Phanerochaete sordida]|uniref:DNA repair protein n=1 Tax=Phanerochaete sordida TaxID=48140 RepID=A0A9P3G233_9APHY|nr:DNA repair protein [Phanerochaete sordida]
MDSRPITAIDALFSSQKAMLKRGNITTVADLMLLPLPDIMRKCKISNHDAKLIVDAVCDELAPKLHRLDDPGLPRDEKFTTGDALLDRLLGGGIRTSKLWEIAGESAAGKTQLAMQLSLCVQLPRNLGGILGSACFISTSWTLPTNRLVEMVDANPLFSPALCGLSDIHTLKAPSVNVLRHVLSVTLPGFLTSVRNQPNAKPVKLIVIDALAELFHTNTETSFASLNERSRNLAELATLLHGLASAHRVAVVVLNEVADVIDRGPAPDARPHEVAYREQARFFGRGDSVPGEDAKEAALGLVWANQVNARIMLSRTKRMRYLDAHEAQAVKRPRREPDVDAGTSRVAVAGQDGEQPIRLRRLTVVFSSVAQPGSLDYIITPGGIVALPEEAGGVTTVERTSPPRKIPANAAAATAPPQPDSSSDLGAASAVDLDGLAPPTDEAHVSSEGPERAENGPLAEEEDEWEAYWKSDELGSDFYSQLDLDALASSLPPSSERRSG